MKKGDIVTVKIFDCAFGGLGVGKSAESGGCIIFVKWTVPGDIARARIIKIKKNLIEAKLEKILEPSSSRIRPRCRHFGSCGGCSLQMVPYEKQLEIKQKMVVDALERIGAIEGIPLKPILGCASPWHYRNKMEYSFSQNAALDAIIGLHEAGRFDRVFDLEECFLQSPLSVEIARAVAEFARAHGIGGELKTLTVREGKNTGEVLVNLGTSGGHFAEEDDFRAFVLEKFPRVSSLYRTAVRVQKGHRTALEEIHLAGKKTLTERLSVGAHTLHFDILPQAFFQPNTLQAETLYECILNAFDGPHRDVLDLFCGTGAIGMFFAAAGARVTGIDVNSAAIENARANAARNSLSNINFVCQNLSSPFHSHTPSLLITDPPRAGIEPPLLKKILALLPLRWIYVSCNPTTLARDLKIACAAGYRMQSVTPVDMFPQTYHVETVCALTL